MTKRGVLLAGLLLALATLLPQAQAGVRTVHLTNDGPTPAGLTIRAGDSVLFVNDDMVPHEVRSQGGWQYDSGPVPPGQTSSATPRLTAPGTYRYSDVRSIVILPQTFVGSLTVPKPQPASTASPTARPTASPTARPTARPTATPTTPAPTPARTSSPGATPSPTPPDPSATPAPTASPSPAPTRTAGPVPSAAPTSPAPTLDLGYGEQRGIAQSSPHRYGLPALMAGVAIGGVLSLLGRYLLSLPEARRTGSS